MLHSNPGDYAWGQGGLDAVITQVVEQRTDHSHVDVTSSMPLHINADNVFLSLIQLLGQIENTGPPPAEKEKISSLPTIIITQEQAG